MALTRSLKPIIMTMRDDPKYKRLKEAFDTLSIYQIPIEKLTEEVETIHRMREIRRLNTEDIKFIDKLISANTNDQSVRGRLTEILMTCSKAIGSLTGAIDSLKYHLIMTHGDSLRSFRTKEERSYIASMALITFVRYVERVQVLKELASLVISDIDKGNWSLRLSVEVLKIHRDPERRI